MLKFVWEFVNECSLLSSKLAMNSDSTMINEKSPPFINTIKRLPYREREIFKLRNGVGDGFIYTVEEAARIFKITPERLRNIEANAMEKITKLTNLTTEQIANAVELLRKEMRPVQAVEKKQ